MYFAGQAGAGPVVLRVRIGNRAIGTFKLYRTVTSGDIIAIATDLDAQPEAARFDLSEGFLGECGWQTLSLRAGIRATTFDGTDYPAELRLEQGGGLLVATDADGAALNDSNGWYDLGTFKSFADHFPMFAVFFR